MRALWIFGLALLAGCSAPPPDDLEWGSYGLDAEETRYSTADQINPGNVAGLGLSWMFEMRDGDGVEATPLMVDETLYVTSAWSIVYALDARTGALKWVFDPDVERSVAAHTCCGPVNRGVAHADGMIFVGALDGRLIAVDRESGKQVWSTRTFDDSDSNYAITGAPRIAGNLVVIGNSGADLGVRGYVSAYDRANGKLVWRFYTVPGNPADGPDNAASDSILAEAAKTWTGEWWRQGGGGTVWDSITYDRELDRVYIGVGNGSPWNRQIRSPGGGDNWFLASIVALDRATGEYVWHYQATPGDTWDATATQSMILTTLRIDGKPRKVLMQAPKNGFFYVIDRDTGKFLSAGNIVPMAKAEDTPAGQPISWAYGIDQKTGRPLENREARYEDGRSVQVHPTGMGAHSWQPMAFSPNTGLAYIPAQDYASTFKTDPGYRPAKYTRASGLEPGGALPMDPKIRDQIRRSVNAKLIAWDPVAQREAWSLPHDYAGNGGLLATAGGLLFQSAGSGVFHAYDARSGAKLWQFDAQATAQGGPITYRLDGEQYIAIAIGNGGLHWIAGGLTSPQRKGPPTGRVLVFKLGGKLEYPRVATDPGPVPEPPAIVASKAQIADGATDFARYCAGCHGFGAVSGQVTPDLRRSPAIQQRTTFQAILLNGLLIQNGMPSFEGVLDEDQAEHLRAFLAAEAEYLRRAGGSGEQRKAAK
jgi:PQQ-dependent dehydrogenase (methanol/ethanol family)